MSNRLAPVLNIDTRFVSQKDKTLSDLGYSGTSYQSKSFSKMDATDIQGLMDELCPSDGLSYDAQVLRNDILSWILERRMNDINGSLKSDNEIFDITDATLNAVTSTSDFMSKTFKNHLRGSMSTSELVEVKNVIDKISEIESGETYPVNKITAMNTLADKDYIDRSYLGSSGDYKCVIFCHIKGDKSIEAVSTHNGSEPNTSYSAFSELKKKLQNIYYLNKYNFLITLIPNFLEFGKSVTPLVKSVLTHQKNEQIRPLGRAADCAGNVPTVKEGTFAYTKGGYYIDKDNNIQDLPGGST